MKGRIARVSLPLVVPFCLLAAWFYLHAKRGSEISYIADPGMVLAKAWTIRGELMANGLLSLRRLLLGVLVGGSLGVLTGTAAGRSRLARLLIGPTLNVLMAIPIIVFIPFFLMAFGFGESFRIAVVAGLVFLLVHQAMFNVVRGFPVEWLELAAHREKREWQIMFDMLLPGGLPELVRSIRLGLLFGWLAVAFSEKAVAQWPGGGLGYQLLRAREQGLYDELFAAAIALGAAAWIVDALVGVVQRHVAHWRATAEAEL
jgi:sulfonate transport system permease protein